MTYFSGHVHLNDWMASLLRAKEMKKWTQAIFYIEWESNFGPCTTIFP